MCTLKGLGLRQQSFCQTCILNHKVFYHQETSHLPAVFCLWSCALSAGMGLNAIEDVFGERRETAPGKAEIQTGPPSLHNSHTSCP